ILFLPHCIYSSNWSAAMDGDLEQVKSLLQKGTEPNLRDSANYTALVRMWLPRLMINDHDHFCKFLLWGGACTNPQTPGGATPLHRSAYCGADPQLCDYDGSSPLHKGHEEVCRLLFQCCPSLWSHANKSYVPYQLAPDGLLKELLEHPQ
uniref:SOCS box domain-containing protein n=1 Tax=Oncorhynchus mykiss TaxID=8022 RepID=A0A8C7TSS7_ONCMY